MGLHPLRLLYFDLSWNGTLSLYEIIILLYISLKRVLVILEQFCKKIKFQPENTQK